MRLHVTHSGKHAVCRKGHVYSESNTGSKTYCGKSYQVCLRCRQLRKYLQTLLAKDKTICRNGLHQISTETTYERPDGNFGCLPCRRDRQRKYDKKTIGSRVHCIASACDKHTNRQHAKTDEPYLCPAHRKDPPDEIVSILRKLGKLYVLDRIPAPRRSA